MLINKPSILFNENFQLLKIETTPLLSQSTCPEREKMFEKRMGDGVRAWTSRGSVHVKGHRLQQA